MLCLFRVHITREYIKGYQLCHFLMENVYRMFTEAHMTPSGVSTTSFNIVFIKNYLKYTF